MTARPQLTVISNSEEDALRAWFRRLYMVEKYVLQVMLECDVQLRYGLLHPDMPRAHQGRIRFNGGVVLGFNPYNRLPSVFYTPLGAVDISRGFAKSDLSAGSVIRSLCFRLDLTELDPVPSIVPGIYQRVFSLGRDPYGNPLPRAVMLDAASRETADLAIHEKLRAPENAARLWNRVRLHEDPSQHEQIMMSLPRNGSHLQAVA